MLKLARATKRINVDVILWWNALFVLKLICVNSLNKFNIIFHVHVLWKVKSEIMQILLLHDLMDFSEENWKIVLIRNAKKIYCFCVVKLTMASVWIRLKSSFSLYFSHMMCSFHIQRPERWKCLMFILIFVC